MTFETTYQVNNATVIVELEEKAKDTYAISMKVEIGEKQEWILKNHHANAKNLYIIAWGLPQSSKKFDIRILRDQNNIEDYAIVVELLMGEGEETAVVFYKDIDSPEVIPLSETGKIPQLYLIK